MAKIRTLDPQVQANAVPGVRDTPNAGSESFGGARASQLKEFGAGLQSVGEGALKAAAVYEQRSQDIRDKSLVRDSLNTAESDMRLIEGDLRRPENREKAIDAYNIAQKQLGELRKKYAAELKSPRQRELFNASFDSQMNGVLDRAYALQETSRVQYQKITRDAQNQSAIENAVSARTDPNEIRNSEITIISNTRADNVGLPKEAVDKAVAAARDNLHSSVLSALAQDDPRAAQGYLKENWEKFNPAAREVKKKELDDKAFDWTVREDALKLVNAGLTEQQIETELNKEKDPVKADALRARVKSVLEDKKIAREIQEKENVFSAWQDVQNGGSIPYGRLNGEEIKSMETYKKAELRGFAQDSDRNILVQLGRLNDQELKEIDEITMAGYANSLSKQDFDAIFTRYRDLRRGKSAGVEPDKLVQIRNDATMVGDALAALGIDPGKSAKKGKAADKENTADQAIVNELSRSFEREINDAQKATGRKLYPEEKQQILDSLLIRGKARKVFGVGKEGPFLFQASDAEIDKNFSLADIPVSVQQQMNDAFKLRGIPATEDNIKNYYLKYLKSKNK